MDIEPSSKWPTCRTLDVCNQNNCRLIWAFLVVYEPEWIHSGFPCTFWCSLSRRHNKRSEAEDQRLRLMNLVFVRFTEQVLWWQCQRGAMASFENCARCASHKLDLIENLGQRASMKQLTTAACAWGAWDVETGKPLLNMRCFFANWDCSLIFRQCACPGGKAKGVHTHIRGKLAGSNKTRVALSTHYEPRLCEAFAKAFRDKQFQPTFSRLTRA